jgi:spore coat protein CotH
MARHKYTNALCIAAVAMVLIVACAFMLGESIGIQAADSPPAYAEKLFSTDRVHSLDIIVDESDWNEMLENAGDEEYIAASLVLDGESIKTVGIRPKGNSSLSQIEQTDSDRYSFKIEFDHYSDGKSYYGLDKLALNNIAQDNTYLKDYASYQMMNFIGAQAPLSSFVYIAVNGKDWGLYLAVEGIEESFAERNYGKDFGKIYKPDSMDIGGREGNSQMERPNGADSAMRFPFNGELAGGFSNQENGAQPGGFAAPDNNGMPDGAPDMTAAIYDEGQTERVPGNMFGGGDGANARQGGFGGMNGGNFGGFGGASGATSLQYTDDDPDSYSAIFDNAVFGADSGDEKRLIAALKSLSEGNIAESVDVEQVIRYFTAHNFVLNSDSYTGSIVHNYYLHEKDGVLSMIAWDYNLAFGGMGAMGGMGRNGGNGSSDSAASLINYPIDTPLLSGDMESRPMISWIFESDEYTQIYHRIMGELMSGYFESGKFEQDIDNAIALISPYVEKDPSAFCTYEDFISGSTTLKEFCLLRAKSIQGQLDGTIPSTSEGQNADNSALIDGGSIDVSKMGSNSMGFGRARDGASNWPGAMGGGFSPPTMNSGAAEEGTFPDAETLPNAQGNERQNMGIEAAYEGLVANSESEASTPPNNARDVNQVGGGMAWQNQSALNRSASSNPLSEPETILILAASAIVLCVGLLFTRRYRRR